MRTLKAIRRLWLFATCEHYSHRCAINRRGNNYVWCSRCGRLLYCVRDGGGKLPPISELDFTKRERARILGERVM